MLGRAYVQLWSASTAASLGGGVVGAAMPLLASDLSRDPRLISAVAVTTELPWLLFGVLAGAIVDRRDRRRLFAAVTAGNACLIAVMITAVALDRTSLPLIYGIAFAGAIGGTLAGTSSSTMAPLLVAPADLARANSRLVSASSAGGELLGPPAGGFLFALGRCAPFAVGLATSAIAAVLVWRLPDRFRPRAPISNPGFRADIAAGIRWLARHRTLRAVTALSAVLALTDSAWFAILVLYIRDVLGLPAGAYGLLVGIGASGGLLGSLAAGRIEGRLGTSRCLFGALLVAADGQVLLGLTADPVLATVGLFTSSGVFGIWNVVTTTLRQTVTPAELLGRVTSVERTAIMGASPLGALLGGLCAGAYGLRAPFLLGLPILLTGALLGYRALRAARA